MRGSRTDDGHPLTRRGLLRGSLALGAGAAGLAACAPGEDATKLEALRAAEAVTGQSFTDAERAQMLEAVEDQLDRLRARREAFQPENSLAPALTFDPRLPTRSYLAQDNSVTVTPAASTALGGPGSDEDIVFASAVQLGAWLRAGALTSLRLTQLYLDRISALNPVLNCFITVTQETALAQAREADRLLAAGVDLGPLHGLPYALKDLADTTDILTSWGAEPYRDRKPTDNATIVTRLKAAGAVLLGKSSLGALAYGDKWFDAVTRNPWAPDEGSSGSSAGSASAVAAGLCAFAIGTETLGSIVSPSTRCGTVGLRPTFGRVSRAGCMALCWSLDKIGPICRYVDDAALVLSVLNGYDPADAASINWGFAADTRQPAAGLRVGYSPAWFEGATDTDKRMLDLLRGAGVELVEVTLPDLPVDPLLGILEMEAAAAFEELTLSGQDDLLSWQEDAAWPNSFRAAHLQSGVELIQQDRLRRVWMQAFAPLFDQVDALISPNFAARLLTITNYTGHPSLTLPVGMESRPQRPLTGTGGQPGPETSLPHTITLWGELFREDTLLRLAKALESTAGFAGSRPSLLQ